MARTRGGKRLNSKTPLAAQESTSHTETASPANHKSKFPYVCLTCSKGYVLRDSFLAHTLDHTRKKLRNVKPKRQHQRELRPTSSLSPTTVLSAWEAELDRSLKSRTFLLSPTTVPSVWNSELWRSLEVQTSSLSPATGPSAWKAELGRSLEDDSSPCSSPFPSLAATATAETLDNHLEDEREFGKTSSSSLSSTPAAPKSSTKRPKESNCVTDVAIPDLNGPKTLKRHASNMHGHNEADPSSPKTLKKHASIMQDNNNEAEPTIIISDDEEDSVTQMTPETGGNYTRFVSTPTVSTSDLDVTSFKIVEKEQQYSDSAMYTTPAKAPNFSYEDSGTSENVSHSYPLPKDASHFLTLPKAKANHVYQGDITLISSDDDEPMAPMKTGSSKKKTVAKRLFSNLPLRQNQLRNGGFDSQDYKSGEHNPKANLIDNSRGDVKEALAKINRLGPIITVTKAKTTQDISNKNPNEAIDKIKQLGPAISFTRLNE